jgi:hypothetical protein
MLKHIAEFFLEKDICGRSAEERRLIRQQRGRPLADAFQKWLRTKRGLISQKGKLADAIRYALSRWKGLTRFLDDGRIKLDNCPVESSIRLSSSTGKMRSLQAPRRRRALRRHRFGDRNLQAERRRSARLSCYLDGHDVELWEGTRQVALLTRSNLPFEQRRPFAAASAPPSGRLLRNDQRSGRLSPCARFPPAPLCVNGPAL